MQAVHIWRNRTIALKPDEYERSVAVVPLSGPSKVTNRMVYMKGLEHFEKKAKKG